jgi:glutathione S-transferase
MIQRMPDAILLAVPASHPCAAVQAALRIKHVRHRRVDLPPVLHKPLMMAAFGRGTVPSLRFADGERVVGSRAIIRALEARVPEPRLRPGTQAVDAAEAWGDEVLQPLARRLVWAALRRNPAALPSYVANARPRVPVPVTRVLGPAIVRAELAIHGSRSGDRNSLDPCLDRVDEWIAEGILGNGRPNAADLQIGASIRLLLTIRPLAAQIDRRPAASLARRLFPDYPGHVP